MSESALVMGRYATPAEYAVVGRCAAKTGYCVSDEHIIAVLRESGHAELIAALKTLLGQYVLFVGPDDDIANATKTVVKDALRKASAL